MSGGKIEYLAPHTCKHVPSIDLPYPGDFPPGAIVRCECGKLVRRSGDDYWPVYWKLMSPWQIRRALRAGQLKSA